MIIGQTAFCSGSIVAANGAVKIGVKTISRRENTRMDKKSRTAIYKRCE